jgi:ferrochelatase
MGGISNKKEVKTFLINMFNDKNIITVRYDWLRMIIAQIIVFFRLNEACKNYEQINFNSPLLKITKSLRKRLEKRLEKKSPYYIVTFAMRYTYPLFQDVIKNLKKYNIEEVILLPLYPQYSTTTTKSSLDDAFLYIDKELPFAKVTFIKRFYNNKNYIKYIVNNIISSIPKDADISSYNIIFSAHSLPESIILNGDSYEKEIQHNVHLLTEEFKRINKRPKDIIIAYQSKLGPVKWLSPSLEDVLQNIPSDIHNEKRAIIYPISFIIDNAEITYELNIMMRDFAHENNFDEYIVCKVPNNSKTFVKILTNIILQEV